MKKTLKELTKNIDMVLFNNIIKVDYGLELESWKNCYLYSDLYLKSQFKEAIDNDEITKDTNFNSESDTYKDIYQYFVINERDWEFLSTITDMPLYYSPVCDLFVLWVDFLDNWENISYEI